MFERVKNQSIGKIMIIIWNVLRMAMIKVRNGKAVNISLLQNIAPGTVIAVKNGSIHLLHSIFTRKNVTFRAEGGELHIGTSFFNQGCSITAKKKIIIGNNCLFGPNVVVVDHDHNYMFSDAQRGTNYLLDEVVIGDNVVVGANSIILKGTIIGDNCMIGAGSIVHGEIPASTLYYTEKVSIEKKIKFNK